MAVWTLRYSRGCPVGLTPDELDRVRAVARSTMATYDALFADAGVSPQDVRAMAGQVQRTLRDWAPDLAEEIERSALVLGLQVWQMYARNARTEILALGPRATGTECSTVGRQPQTERFGRHGTAAAAAQTWDWHDDLTDGWLVVVAPEAPIPFATMTELGIVGKAGINAAGVGVLLNMLHHASDASAGPDDPVVPVHVVARRILDSSRSLAEARTVIAGAPIGASSCLTLVGPEGIDCVELSPARVASLPSYAGWVVHTNHFLDAELAVGDTRDQTNETTPARYRATRTRVQARDADWGRGWRSERDRFAELLDCHDQSPDAAPLCCHADPSAAFHDKWSTLSTVVLEPVAADTGRPRMSVSPSGPCQVTAASWASYDL